MMKKIIASVALVLLVTVAMVQAMEQKKEDNAPGLKIGKDAPDFELQTLDGQKVSLSDLKGKKVMLNFWATWCPPCKAEMPEMEEFQQQLSKDEVILAVNIDPQNDVEGFIDSMGVTFPIALDEDGEVNKMYKILTIPTTYFIDSDGVIQGKFIGAMSLKDMEEHMGELK
ncbi:redoxin domain-containing protein [Peribacillus alkalitolerans]|uniref:redoxin domain-containing protein n=1 Tax=Peribacillus alkalitolerans TaxID=1550385 RepID=UPI0013D2BA6C|nr:redoxin domain-containing protein [Peribacillus alkalitolerans]